MLEKVAWKINTMPKSRDVSAMALMTMAEAEKARRFHKSFPQYEKTPLVSLSALASKLGLAGVYVKDESYRFGLNAFKVLGASYAIAKYTAERLGKDISDLDYEKLISDDLRKEIGDITFYTTTDGNHGRGVAWAASRLKQKSVVYMPKGSSSTRLNNIRKEGAHAEILDLYYDDAVRFTAEESAKTPKSVVLQDTAWEGYKKIPSWIMQGYGTMALESSEQLESYGINCPTHVFVQAGVGTLAGAIQSYFSNRYPENGPKVIVVEASAADCFYRSAVKNDGNKVAVGGSLSTIMAGLACGEVNPISFEILSQHTSCFVSVPDWISAKGMRMLGNPLRDDQKVISGESGAVSIGLIAAIMENDNLRDLREALCLDEKSQVLCFSTEGDTDPQKYLDIVWDGDYPSR